MNIRLVYSRTLTHEAIIRWLCQKYNVQTKVGGEAIIFLDAPHAMGIDLVNLFYDDTRVTELSFDKVC